LSLFFKICLVDNNNDKYENFDANFNEDNNNNNNKDESFLQMQVLWLACHSGLVCGKANCRHYLSASRDSSQRRQIFVWLFAKASDFRLALRKGVRFSKMF
jgi:hypothetical protein